MSDLEFERAITELKAGTDDLRPSDVMIFSEPLRSALIQAVRLGRISLTELTELLGFSRDQTAQVADILVTRNLLHRSAHAAQEEPVYESRVSSMTRPLTRPPSDIWKKIND